MGKIILISLGDPNGIGPEVAAGSVNAASRRAPIVLIGAAASLRPWAKRMGGSPSILSADDLKDRASSPAFRPGLYLIETAKPEFRPVPGRMTSASARVAFRSFKLAVDILVSDPGRFSLVTAPVSKEGIIRAGIRFSGHTGYLAGAFGVDPVMLLMSGRMRVALVTEHIPLAQVAASVTAGRVMRVLTVLSAGLGETGISNRPLIAVLGLNPHAGEGGRIGTEDRVIASAIRTFNRRNRSRAGRAIGPLPADSAFSPEFFDRVRPDAYLAMYHDQGLVAVKRAGLHAAINVTLGLPARRSSPAHGTAFDIAGRGVADARSMRLAVDWALR